jgi:hypothetical protein
METLRAERVSLLLARQLPQSVAGYYKLVDESTEEEIPASRVLKIEQVEPLGLAVQMYCLFLRALQVDEAGVDRMTAVAWTTLELSPECRDDVVAQARQYYEEMRAYPSFKTTASVDEMIAERCQALFPVMTEAPELQAYVTAVSQCFNLLQRFAIA